MLSPAPKTILIVNIRLIGDTILATPLIGLLSTAYPGAAIDLLVNRGTGEFLEKDPRVRNVLYSEKGEVGAGRRSGGYQRAIFRKYDLAINMNASDRGNIAVLLAGRRWRVGFCQGTNILKNGWKKLLFTHTIDFPFAIHVARLSQLVAQALGIEAPRLEAKVFWSAEDQALVTDLLKNKGVSASYFVIHPLARWHYKYWNLERFAAVNDAIVEQYGLRPVWTSSPAEDEKRLLLEGAALCRHRPALFAGELDLNQMTCLIGGASLYVGLDTAVSHLAATTGVPMVALYGPTIVERWSPWNNQGEVAQQCPQPRGVQRVGNITVIQKGWECVPCGRAGCDDSGMESPCMRDIETEEVLEAVAALMAGAA
jgi:heptosyltransferase III